MSDTSQGDGWWIASDGKWYAPEQHPDYVAPGPPTNADPAAPESPNYAADTIAVPLGGEPAIESAVESSPTPHPGPSFSAPGAATHTYDVATPTDPDYNLGPTDTPSSSKRGLILGIGACVLVAGLGFLAFRFFTGAGSAGGAESPESAIDQLIASVNERDAVGFVDVFDPDEIEAWFGSFAPAFSEFERINESGEEINNASDAYEAIFDAFDYTLSGPGGEAPTYDVAELDDNGRIARVRVSALDFEISAASSDRAIIGAFGGDASALDLSSLNGTRLEVRDERSGLAARLLVPGEPAEDEFTPDSHLDLVTVQKDGKWYISIGYSVLELARTSGEFDRYSPPDFGRAFELVDTQTGGADSAEAVVQELFESIEGLDYENVIRITDPLGTPYLHDYQPVIDDQVDQESRRDEVREAALNFDELELGVSQWEGRTLVTMTDVSGRSSGGEFSIDTTTWCATIEDEFDRDRACIEDAIAEALFEIDSDRNPRDFIPEQTGVIVVERNGRWYLDPLATMGYYTDQIAADLADLIEDMEGNPATELGDFLLAEGPIARQGVPATQLAESGSAGVAIDLDGYPTVSDSFETVQVALARVVTDRSGTFVSDDDVPLTGEDWLVVWDSEGAQSELPAIAAATDGELDVELFEVQITEVGPDGHTGQLGGQGRPQVFVLTSVESTSDVTVAGAEATSVFAFGDNGVVFMDSFDTGSGISTNATFAVVTGEPGASFTIAVESFVPEPDPPPAPTPVPDTTSSNFADPLASDFELLVEPRGFLFGSEQSGGFFDGCGGPDDPDVTSYVFEQTGGALVVLTPFPSADRAQSSFEALVNVASPCEAFSAIQVNEVVRIGSSDIRIEWELIDDPEEVIYEHYQIVGDTIVVATNASLVDLDDQLALLSNWAG